MLALYVKSPERAGFRLMDSQFHHCTAPGWSGERLPGAGIWIQGRAGLKPWRWTDGVAGQTHAPPPGFSNVKFSNVLSSLQQHGSEWMRSNRLGSTYLDRAICRHRFLHTTVCVQRTQCVPYRRLCAHSLNLWTQCRVSHPFILSALQTHSLADELVMQWQKLL